MNFTEVSSLLIGLGVTILLFAILKTRSILVLLKKSSYLKPWRYLFFLMIFFSAFYIASIFFISTGFQKTFIFLIGLVFLMGACFVYLVANVSHRTIDSLIETRRSKQFLDDVLRYIPHSIVVTDDKNLITSINKPALNLTGLPEKEIIGKPFHSVFYSENSNGGGLKSPHALVEKKYFKRDGKDIPVLLSTSFLEKTNKSGPGIIYSIEDISELKDIQLKLVESENKYRSIIEEAGDVVYTCDHNGYFTYFNTRVKKLMGYDPAELIGKKFTDVIDPEWREKIRLYYFDQFKNLKDETVYEFPVITRSGESKWVEVMTVILREGKWVKGFQCIVRDVHQRKLAEKALYESEERYKLLTRLSPVGFFEADSAGHFTFINKRWSKITGFPDEKTLGSGWFNTIYEEDREMVYNEWKNSAKEKREFKLEFRFLRPDGEFAWVFAIANGILDEKGEVKGYLGAIADITEQKNGQIKLQESEKKYKKLINEAGDVIYTIDSRGNFTFLNDRVEKLTGYKGPELLGKNFTVLVHPDWIEKTVEFYKQQLKSRTHETIYEFPFVTKDGTTKWVEQIVIMVAEAEDISGFQCIVRDITERRDAEEKIKNLIKEIEQNKFKALLESAPDSIVIINEKGKIVLVNSQTERIFGFAKNEFLDQQIEQFIPGSFLFGTKEHKSSTEPLELEGKKKDGSVIPVEISLSPITTEDETLLSIGIRDITERKKAEKVLRTNEQQLDLIYNVSTAIIFLICVDGGRFKFISTNRAFLEATGLSKEQVEGKYLEDVIPPDALPIVLEKYQQALDEKKTVFWEETTEYPTGKKTGIVKVTPIFNEQHECNRLLGTVHDITERKAAEEEIRLSREKYFSLINTIDGIVWESDPETGRFTFVSKQAERLMGFPSEQWIKEPSFWADHIHPDDRDWATELCARKTRTEQLYNFEYRMITADGKVIWLKDFVSVILENGKPARLNGIMIDITERKNREFAEKERVKKIINFQSILLELSLLKELSLEDTFKRITDSCSEALATQRSGIWLYSQDRASIICECLTSIKAGNYEKGMTVFEKDYPVYFKSLEEKRTIAAVDAIHDPATYEFRDEYLIPKGINSMLDIPIRLQGKVLGVLCNEHVGPQRVWTADEQVFASSVADLIALTLESFEKKKAEQEAVKFSSLVKNSADFIGIASNEGEILFVNDYGRKLVGLDPDEGLETKKVSDFLSSEGLKKSNEIEFPAVMKKGFWQGESTLVNFKTKKEIPVSVTSFILKDPSGENLGIATIQRDISEHIKADKEIRELNEKLEQRVIERTKELESFSYSVSHDLRAPLRAINGYAKILEDEFSPQLSEEAKRFVNIITTNSKKMGQLIDDLLAFSRLGRKEVVISDIDMENMVKNVVEEVKVQNADRKITVDIQKLESIRGEMSMIRQVWVNLILNAVKYSKTKPETIISIGYEKGKNETIYYVKDNGVGFDMQYVGKLFGVFQRLHSETEFEGTGVGLAIVKRIIDKHGGRVWAESRLDEGSVFYFSLPVNQPL